MEVINDSLRFRVNLFSIISMLHVCIYIYITWKLGVYDVSHCVSIPGPFAVKQEEGLVGRCYYQSHQLCATSHDR